MLIASLSLMAIPYLSGNVSKDLILELSAVHLSIPSTFMWILGSVIAGVTACYSVRLLALTFLGQPNASKYYYQEIHEQPIAIIIPMVVLTVVAIFFGFIAKEPLGGMGTDSIVYFYYTTSNLVEAEFGLFLLGKNFPIICTFIGTFLGIVLFILIPSLSLSWFNHNNKIIGSIYSFLSNKWLIDPFLARFFSWSYLNFGLFCSKLVDRGILELIGTWGLTYRASVLHFLLVKENKELIISGPTDQLEERKSALIYSNIPENALYIGILVLFSIVLLLVFNFYPVVIILLFVLGLIF